MTLAEQPDLTAAELLEAHYGLTADALGLTAEGYVQRLKLWERAVTAWPVERREAGLRTLALRAWVTRLVAQADKFRAEGDITVERDILGRIEVVRSWLATAEAEGAASAAATGSANPSPELVPWGIG